MGTLGLVLLVGAVSVPMTACAGGGREADAPTTTPAAMSSSCKAAPRALANAIAARLTERETLRNAQAVRSRHSRSAWLRPRQPYRAAQSGSDRSPVRA